MSQLQQMTVEGSTSTQTQAQGGNTQTCICHNLEHTGAQLMKESIKFEWHDHARILYYTLSVLTRLRAF